jgi:ubiquinone/menaquinone biosynthesis C-methylase UbiE
MDFADPEHNIEQLGLTPGMKVADLGAGSGYYALAAAKRVESEGHVYAVEIQKDLLTRIKNVARKERLHNIDVFWGDIEELHGTKLSDASVDAVILSNILFQVENKTGTLQEAKRILKGGGKLLIVDWADSFNNLGPEPNAVISLDQARLLGEKEGFHFERTIQAGAHHYGLIMKKS